MGERKELSIDTTVFSELPKVERCRARHESGVSVS